MTHTALIISFLYMVLALIEGVFAREYTKRKGLGASGLKQTNLADLHVHTFVLGMALFLIVALFAHIRPLAGGLWIAFLWTYNIGLIGMLAMLFVRGIAQAAKTQLTKAQDSSISGLAGVFHVVLSIGLVLLFVVLLQRF